MSQEDSESSCDSLIEVESLSKEDRPNLSLLPTELAELLEEPSQKVQKSTRTEPEVQIDTNIDLIVNPSDNKSTDKIEKENFLSESDNIISRILTTKDITIGARIFSIATEKLVAKDVVVNYTINWNQRQNYQPIS